MNKHTPEPWEEFTPAGATFQIIDADGIILADVYDRDDAKRIVACVNACRGINPEAVPLLMARVLDHANNGPGIHGEICPSCGRDNRESGNVCTSDDCMAVQARAAIAKATQEL